MIAANNNDHFSALLNSVQNIDLQEFVCERIEHGIADKEIVAVSASDVLDSLKTVKLGKAAGIDGLSAEHFVCAHIGISVHLSLLFTSMLSHGHMPAELMKTAIVPILKNRQGDTSDKNNYRPIAIVMALSKIFELCIMRKVETQLITSDNQFGFKREHGTDLCIFTVKSVIKYYNLHNSPVYYVFLMLLKPMIVLITGHCSENYSTDQFIFLLLECLCIGTQSKNYVLGGELK